MVTLNVVQDEEIKNELFLKSGMTRNDDSCCLIAKDGEKCIGYSVFDLNDKSIIDKFYKDGDMHTMYVGEIIEAMAR